MESEKLQHDAIPLPRKPAHDAEAPSAQQDPLELAREYLAGIGDIPAHRVLAMNRLLRRAGAETGVVNDSLAVVLADEVNGTTAVLAHMIVGDFPLIPSDWESPDGMRAVLSMSAHIEAGLLRAQQVALEHDIGVTSASAGLSRRADALDALVAALRPR